MYSKKIFVAQRPYMSQNPLLWFYGSSVYLSYFTTLVHSHKVLVVESWGRGSKGRVVFASKNSSAINGYQRFLFCHIVEQETCIIGEVMVVESAKSVYLCLCFPLKNEF